jgi:hypothetical protein
VSVTHNTAVRTAIADAVCNATTGQLGASGKIVIYSGAAPVSASAILSGNVAIATITGLNFGNGASGVSTVTSSTADSNAVGGTASFFRVTTTAGVVTFQGSAGASGSGADMILSNSVISAGANVALTGSNTYTAPV